jgi:hypothetical protein
LGAGNEIGLAFADADRVGERGGEDGATLLRISEEGLSWTV